VCVWVWHYILIYMHKEFCHREMHTQLTIPTEDAHAHAHVKFSFRKHDERQKVTFVYLQLFFPSRDGIFGQIGRLNIQPDPFDRFAKFGERSVLTLLISRKVTFDGKKNSYLFPSFFFPFNTLSAENLSLAFGTLAHSVHVKIFPRTVDGSGPALRVTLQLNHLATLRTLYC